MIAAFAARQAGVVGRGQLLEATVTHAMVRARLASGHLLPLHRGVYAVGHARLTRDGFRHAALLAAGAPAALSHREAAAVHALLPAPASRVEVSTPGQRQIAGVVVRRARLDADDVTTVDGLRTTTVARTLVDLAAILPAERLRKALDEAERSHRLDVGAVAAALGRVRQRRGSGHQALRAALADLAQTGATLTRSELEDRLIALLEARNLPRPRTSALTAGMEVDAAWPAARLVVELDGWAYHRTRAAFERDRERDAELAANGWTVLRFTHRHVVRRPAWVAERIRGALAQAAAATG